MMDYFFNFEKLAYLKGERPQGCILCLVSQGDKEVVDLTVYNSSKFIVSLNLYPYNPGHVLIFPKRHITDLRALQQEEREDFDVILRLTLDVMDGELRPGGYNIGCNMGTIAGASIDHLHWHIIPRYPREIGIAELLAGRRVLVDNPLETQKRLVKAFDRMTQVHT
jgi:ATP adenylyltransferase